MKERTSLPLRASSPAGLEQIRGGADGRLGGCRSSPAGKQGQTCPASLSGRVTNQSRGAVRASYGLGVGSAGQGSAYSAAQRGQAEAGHAGHGPVIGDGAGDGVARAALVQLVKGERGADWRGRAYRPGIWSQRPISDGQHSGHSVLVSRIWASATNAWPICATPPIRAMPTFTNCTNCGRAAPRHPPADRAVTSSVACFPLCPPRRRIRRPLDSASTPPAHSLPGLRPRLLVCDPAGQSGRTAPPCLPAGPLRQPPGRPSAPPRICSRPAGAGPQGLGGFPVGHTTRQAEAMRRLRQHKQRPHKPGSHGGQPGSGPQPVRSLTPERPAARSGP